MDETVAQFPDPPRRPARGRANSPPSTTRSDAGYVLAAEDLLSIRVLDLEEFDPKNLGVIRIDLQGNIRLPLVGRLHASGLTVEQLEKEIVAHLSGILHSPEVIVTISEFRSHPVSVLGAVKNRESSKSRAARPCLSPLCGGMLTAPMPARSL